MSSSNDLTSILKGLPQDLIAEIQEQAQIQVIPKHTELLRAGQYVKVIPLVVSGLIKVHTRYEDRELLLYYIQPSESCIMSFSAGIKNEVSQVYAYAEEESEVLLLPVDRISSWIKQYPDLNELFFQQYNLRYIELLDTINHLLFDTLDKRVLQFLQQRARLTDANPLKISHRQIAQELGTAREVVSRVIKKLEHQHKIKQHSHSIELLEW